MDHPGGNRQRAELATLLCIKQRLPGEDSGRNGHPDLGQPAADLDADRGKNADADNLPGGEYPCKPKTKCRTEQADGEQQRDVRRVQCRGIRCVICGCVNIYI